VRKAADFIILYTSAFSFTKVVCTHARKSGYVQTVLAVIAGRTAAFLLFGPIMEGRAAKSAEFQLRPHRIFLGFDVYNEGSKDATIELRSPEVRELTVTVKAGELRRFRTGWRDPSSQVLFRFENGQGLRFDNLAFSRK